MFVLYLYKNNLYIMTKNAYYFDLAVKLELSLISHLELLDFMFQNFRIITTKHRVKPPFFVYDICKYCSTRWCMEHELLTFFSERMSLCLNHQSFNLLNQFSTLQISFYRSKCLNNVDF